ncbi:thiaminase/transcriptional activator TenA [Naumannella cuiyingiana]|uniref:Aminopyrimidine aminohydrolase n=1 Tax=Naumannella cuiyingiana TaxID=1347891 RepID=A0A7Z0D9G4_9ACTN|nr:thiaminase/transcriptional activator TenA [Naumannella cuiyingiana]
MSSAEPLSARLWRAGEHAYARILQHPFLIGLADGSLPREQFAHYIVQDAHYLRAYSRALSTLSARAPTEDAVRMFALHSAEAIDVERALHESLLGDLGLTPADLDRIGPGPTTTAYMSYLLATTASGSFAEGVAAVLPCYWIYREVGRVLVRDGSPDELYARWIATYGGDEFDAVVDQALALTDTLQVSPAEFAACERHFAMAARYEWMFWDAAWQRLQWPF